MVIEHVELPIIAGREEDFAATMRHAINLLRGAAGCVDVTLARGVERPSQHLLLIHWNTIESHSAFTATPAFKEIQSLLGGFLAARPAMEHFAPLV